MELSEKQFPQWPAMLRKTLTPAGSPDKNNTFKTNCYPSCPDLVPAEKQGKENHFCFC